MRDSPFGAGARPLLKQHGLALRIPPQAKQLACSSSEGSLLLKYDESGG